MTRDKRSAAQQTPQFVWEAGDSSAREAGHTDDGSAAPEREAEGGGGDRGERAERGKHGVTGRVLIAASVFALVAGGGYALLSANAGHDAAVVTAGGTPMPDAAPSTDAGAPTAASPSPSASTPPSPAKSTPASPAQAPERVKTVYVTPTQAVATHAVSTPAAPATTHSAPAVSGQVVGYDAMCLDDRGGGVSNGNPVQIFSCDGTNSQLWTVEPDGTIRSSGMCMDVEGGNDTDGTLIDLYQCNGTGAQVWQSRSDGELFNPLSGKCLDDKQWGGSGTQLEIWDCNDGTNQQWNLP